MQRLINVVSSSCYENIRRNAFSQIPRHKYNTTVTLFLKVSLDSVRKKLCRCVPASTLFCLGRKKKNSSVEVPSQICDPLFWMWSCPFPTDLLKLINVWFTLKRAPSSTKGDAHCVTCAHTHTQRNMSSCSHTV